jgi:negative regulator of sigma E activity
MNPELDEKLSALLDGELSPAEAAALREEVSRSPELTARLAALASVDDGLRELPSPGVPADLRARLSARLEAPGARTLAASRARPRRWLAAAALAAAAAALVLFGLPRAQREETRVAQTEPAPVVPPPPVAPAPPPPVPVPVEIVEQPPPAPAPLAVEPSEEEDLPVIAVLDVLAELDELEEVGSG